MSETPFANLNPHLILDAIESAGYACNGSLFGLNSFENRVYQIGIHDSPPLIAKFYRPGRWSDSAILEEHEFSLELAAHEIPVVAPMMAANHKTLHHFQDYRFALFERRGGRALDYDNLEHLEWMGRFIGRLHAVGSCKSFQHRLRLDVDTYGHNSYEYLLENNFIPDSLQKSFEDVSVRLLAKITERFAECPHVNYIRLHGDCHVGNILWNDTGPNIVDLDDCLMGPAVQDIWMMLTGNNPDQIARQTQTILQGYTEFHDFNYRELHLIEALRALRMIMYSSWLARRWNDPTFPVNFPWFNTFHYWQVHIRDLQEQIDLLTVEE